MTQMCNFDGFSSRRSQSKLATVTILKEQKNADTQREAVRAKKYSFAVNQDRLLTSPIMNFGGRIL